MDKDKQEFLKLDNLHIRRSDIDRPNKTTNFIISAREAGKSTVVACDFIHANFKKGLVTPLILRRKVQLTEEYIGDVVSTINKFCLSEKDPEPYIPFFSKLSLKQGVCNVYLGKKKDGSDKRLAIRLIALSCDENTLKHQHLKNVGPMVFDEWTINPAKGEKYLNNETWTFKVLYGTLVRESPNLKRYFFGNPYSVYNPYFLDLDIDSRKIREGARLFGPDWQLWAYPLKPELVAKIKASNPDYRFDDSYSRFAVGGIAVNDQNIIITPVQPQYYYLQMCFLIHNKVVGVFKNPSPFNGNYFWARIMPDGYHDRISYCFDFQNLVNNAVMYDTGSKYSAKSLKKAIGLNKVGFQNIEVAYFMQEIYTYL